MVRRTVFENIRCHRGKLGVDTNNSRNQKVNSDVENRNVECLYGKGLVHDPQTLLPDGENFRKLIVALREGTVEAMDELVGVSPPALAKSKNTPSSSLLLENDRGKFLGGRRRLVNPLASWATTSLFMRPLPTIHPPPSLGTKHTAVELLEVYEMALHRDVPFCNYSSSKSPTSFRRVLTGLKFYEREYDGPHPISASALFRGVAPGCTIGPYVSQLLLHDFSIGAHHPVVQTYGVYTKGDYGISKTEALAIANGSVPLAQGRRISPELMTSSSSTVPPFDKAAKRNVFNGEADSIVSAASETTNGMTTTATTMPMSSISSNGVLAGMRRVYNGRALATIVHSSDDIYLHFYYASVLLREAGAALHPALTQSEPAVSSAYVTCGGLVGVTAALGSVVREATTVAWHQKWRRHMRLRPEEAAARVAVAFESGGSRNCPCVVHPSLLQGEEGRLTLEAVAEHNESMGGDSAPWLPMAYAEGSPTHPSYPSGHAVVAGACATLLKLFYRDGPWSGLERNSTKTTGTERNGNGIGVALEVNADGRRLLAYRGPDVDQMTIHGEINKLAANLALGRCFAGVNFRSDADRGLVLGEQVATAFFKHQYLDLQPREPLGRNGNSDRIIVASLRGDGTKINPLNPYPKWDPTMDRNTLFDLMPHL